MPEDEDIKELDENSLIYRALGLVVDFHLAVQRLTTARVDTTKMLLESIEEANRLYPHVANYERTKEFL